MYNINTALTVPLPDLSISEVKDSIQRILEDHQVNSCEIGVIFVTIEYIEELNKRYFYKTGSTDVIAFPLSETGAKCLEGELYICAEMAKQQAREYNVTWENELMRLIFHGTLHLLAYDDREPEGKRQMTLQEDKYLDLHFNAEQTDPKNLAL